MMSYASQHHFLQLFNESELRSLSESIHAIHLNSRSGSSTLDPDSGSNRTRFQVAVPSFCCVVVASAGESREACTLIDIQLRGLSISSKIVGDDSCPSTRPLVTSSIESMQCDGYSDKGGQQICCIRIVSGESGANGPMLDS